MIRGLYSAATGLQTASENQEVQAENLANASAPGYRQRGLAFETFDRVLNRNLPPVGDSVGARTAGMYIDFRPGAMQQTGNPFDLALGEPDQFFAVAGPNGTLYTRNGSFRVATNGALVTQGGYPVLGDTGPITVPPESTRIDIGKDGSIIADGNPSGQVRLVRFGDVTQLAPAGPTLFAAGPNATPRDGDGRVFQGFKESSNVQPADVMVRMILGSRLYDAAQRSIRTIGDTLQLNTRPQ